MSLSVLFVDDEPPMLRALKRDFSCDYDVTVAYSADEAQTLLCGPRCFDVVVTDVTMPGMNGLEFIETVAPNSPHTAFVVLTGNCDAATYERARSLSPVACVLTKPASREQILQAIGEAIRDRNTSHQPV